MIRKQRKTCPCTEHIDSIYKLVTRGMLSDQYSMNTLATWLWWFGKKSSIFQREILSGDGPFAKVGRSV
jgi:hypothetical protein